MRTCEYPGCERVAQMITLRPTDEYQGSSRLNVTVTVCKQHDRIIQKARADRQKRVKNMLDGLDEAMNELKRHQ